MVKIKPLDTVLKVFLVREIGPCLQCGHKPRSDVEVLSMYRENVVLQSV